MPPLKLFHRMIVRPLLHEPVRLALTVVAVALGVAVVLAIDMAGSAAAGSFRSSMQTLAGDNDLEIVGVGGIPEQIVATLTSLPYALRISPRVEDYAVIVDSKESVPVIGIDLISEGTRFLAQEDTDATASTPSGAVSMISNLSAPGSIWLGESFQKRAGDKIELLINDRSILATVRGVFPDSGGSERAILMDIAGAQRAAGRFGRIDRILVKLPADAPLQELQAHIQDALPPGIEVRPQGTSTEENRKMLSAFRWNLRLLSCIALIVGAFLIYNTISVSVVRRRAEIGIVRALGASGAQVLSAFLAEAACIGLAGAFLALPVARLMANGAVRLMAATVESLYVSSRPGKIELTTALGALAVGMGVGVALVSALAPSREALQVAPLDAMARGRREYAMKMRSGRNLLTAFLLGAASLVASQLPPVAGKPLFGYFAAVLSICAAAYAVPSLVSFISVSTSRVLGKLVGIEGLLASRSLAASLRRTSVLVAAMATAVAMMTSVGIMVGSFRQTVVSWMADQLPADLYLRPAGNPAPDRHPTISAELPDEIAKIPGVAAVERLRAYEISYEQMPATLASVDLSNSSLEQHTDFLSGRSTRQVFSELHGKEAVIVSEAFAYKHHVKRGDDLSLSLAAARANFKIADVAYDYASERGYILMDRQTMLKYLPDPAPSNLAVFVSPGFDRAAVRERLQKLVADHHLLLFSDRDLRDEAIRIFDRTFAITYALEAIAVLVAVMGIAGALLALVMDRRRELGLLRFLGASRIQIRKLILVEAGLVGILSSIAGAILGYFLSLILVFVINKQSFGWTIHFHWPIVILLGGLTTVYLATVLSGIYPAVLASRVNPLEVMHEE
jgi:putative ABC transport system permease protein